MAEPLAPPIAAQERKPSLFGSQKPAAMPAETTPQQDMMVLTTRLRVAEERYADIRRKLQLIEQNMLLHQKRSQGELKTLQNDMTEMKRTIKAIEDRVITVIKELQLTAKREDVDVMKRYVEMWNPIRFVSQEQVERIVDEKLGKHSEEMHEE